MAYSIVFAPAAQAQLAALYRDIASAASPNTAARYVDPLVAHYETLRTIPYRGTLRDDIRPGLRTTHYRKQSVIAFVVDADQVAIIGVFYSGQDYEATLSTDENDSL